MLNTWHKNIKWHTTLYPGLSAHLALQLYKAFIRSKLELGVTVWGFKIHNAKHLKLLQSAKRDPASLILKIMKSIPTDGLWLQLSILPIDLRLQELQWHEVVKLLIKEDDYIQSNMIGRNKSPFENLRFINKQILQFLSQTKKLQCQPITSSKENSSYPWCISHTKPLTNSSRNKASVISSIR